MTSKESFQKARDAALDIAKRLSQDAFTISTQDNVEKGYMGSNYDQSRSMTLVLTPDLQTPTDTMYCHETPTLAAPLFALASHICVFFMEGLSKHEGVSSGVVSYKPAQFYMRQICLI